MKQQITKGVKAFRKTEDGRIVTGSIDGSVYTEWEIGEVYELDNDLPLELCKNGFHFYREKDACFGETLFGNETVFFTIEAYGDIVSDTEKCVCKSIKLIDSFTPVLDSCWNSGGWNSGYMNSTTPQTIRVFNTDTPVEEWDDAEKPSFLYFSIEDGETYKSAFRRSWENTTDEDRALLEKLPNFSWDVFTEISGIEKPDWQN